MTGRRLSAFIDALAAGRRPKSFPADPEDAAIVRMAIELRAARPGDANPDEQFVSDLFETLSGQLSPPVVPGRVKTHRGRIAIAAIAASVALVGGTIAVTEAVNQPAPTTSALPAPHGKALRTATFENADDRVMGQIVVYNGHPSWVYMNVAASTYNGPVLCMLRGNDGSVVAVGGFVLRHGSGAFSKTIRVNVGQLRGARLVTPAGTVLASAHFA